MPVSKNAETVLERRYLIRDESRKVTETVEGLFHRVAGSIAGADKPYTGGASTEALEKEFYEAMTNLEFLPNSPTLMNAGRPWASCRPALCCRWPTRWRTSVRR